MPFTVAPMQRRDAEAVAGLWRAYMTELYREAGHMTSEVFLRDGLGAAFDTLVAKGADGSPVGVAVWWMTYDVHHGARGGEIPDMFVEPSARGLGVAVQLIAAAALQVRERGGVFLRAPATHANAQRLVRSGRLNGAFPLVAVYWGERLFAALADNADADPRTLARRLAVAKVGPLVE